MKAVPEIRQFESLEALIQIFQEPGAFAQQLKRLSDAEKTLNDKYKLAGTLQEGEAYLAESAAKLEESRDIRRHADEILTAAKAQAERMTGVAADEARATLERVMRLETEAQAKLQDAKGAMDAARVTEAQGQQALSEASVIRVNAAQELADARAIRAEYQERLSKLQALAAG